MDPLISICIPTYRQTFLLKENLDSICAQSYKNIEVLISDDTPDDSVKELVQSYHNRLPVRYWQNKPSLGSPENWNRVLDEAKGDYVLLLHHDDQFANADALYSFLLPFLNNGSIDFVFGRNLSIENLVGDKPFPSKFFQLFYKVPAELIVVNVIGPPSNVLLKKGAVEKYDKRLKWIVDIENYTRLFKKRRKFYYIDKTLIKTGIHEGQVTNECISNPSILLYENTLYAIENISSLKSIRVFDFYWRLFRNNNARSIEDIVASGIVREKIPFFIRNIIKVQSAVSPSLLKKGILSKPLMFFAFLLGR